MNTPVLFIVFKRLDTTKKVFAEIKKYKPKKLYIAADGARSNFPDEATKVNSVRDYLLDNIDWECELKTLFHDKNLGCKYGPHSAISWFFDNEEQGIILEDDCLPSNSFFSFCSELLDRYKNDMRVFGISGVNFHSKKSIDNSYYFSSYFFTWGWATWRSRWKQHLNILDSFYEYANDSLKSKSLINQVVMKNLVERATVSYEDKLDAWDYPWALSCIINNGLIVSPKKNLIKNIGFGLDATHTNYGSRNQREIENLDFPLQHPRIYKENQELDQLLYKNVFMWLSPVEKVTNLKYVLFVAKLKLHSLRNRIAMMSI